MYSYQHYLQLILGPEDEYNIFTNLTREWHTPSLVWTQNMMKEYLLILIE